MPHSVIAPFKSLVRAALTRKRHELPCLLLLQSAAKYVPRAYRIANPDEIEARRTARNLKIPTDAAIQIAAPAMAALIDGPCWLVPVPASNAGVTANLALAQAIAAMVCGARVKCALSYLIDLMEEP